MLTLSCNIKFIKTKSMLQVTIKLTEPDLYMPSKALPPTDNTLQLGPNTMVDTMLADQSVIFDLEDDYNKLESLVTPPTQLTDLSLATPVVPTAQPTAQPTLAPQVSLIRVMSSVRIPLPMQAPEATQPLIMTGSPRSTTATSLSSSEPTTTSYAQPSMPPAPMPSILTQLLQMRNAPKQFEDEDWSSSCKGQSNFNGKPRFYPDHLHTGYQVTQHATMA